MLVQIRITDPCKYFNETFAVRVSDLQVLVPPSLCIRNEQPFPLRSVGFLQTMLS